MNSALIAIPSATQASTTQGIQTGAKPNIDAYNAFSANAFGGQSSFLALLLGQASSADGFKNIDLSQFKSVDTKNTASSGFNLDQFAFDKANLNTNGFINADGQFANLAANQSTIQENNQKIREFLTSLIEILQTSPEASAANASSQTVRQGNSANTNNTDTSASTVVNNKGGAQTIQDLISSLISSDTTGEVVNVQNNQLTIDVSSLNQTDQDTLLQQASILSSGISIQELNALKQAVTQQKSISTGKDAISGLTDATDNPLALGGITLASKTGNAASRNQASGAQQNLVNGQANTTNGASQNSAAQSNAHFVAPVAGQQQAQAPNNPALTALAAQTVADDAVIASSTTADDALAKGFEVAADVRSVNNITNPLASVRQAGMPHPASESLAVQIQRQAKTDGRSELIIELDPPELGKVKVEMNIDAQKAVNAKIVVERPETLAMLQRDEGVLQKALQDMGLDVSGESFSFDLAQQSGGDQQGQSDFGKAQSHAGFDNGQPSDIIQTQMNTIYIDPNTGFVRVNIMA